MPPKSQTRKTIQTPALMMMTMPSLIKEPLPTSKEQCKRFRTAWTTPTSLTGLETPRGSS